MDNSLAIRNPKLAKQWHETKNGTLTLFKLQLVPIKKHGGNAMKDMSGKHLI
jgi:hypothetical protein